MDDWPSQIVVACQIRQHLEVADVGGLYEYHWPEVAASEDELAAAEASLGFGLDPYYRSFLRFANGWRNFRHDRDLFGTAQLLGAYPMDSAQQGLAAVDDSDFEAAVGLGLTDVYSIGASKADRDIYLIVRQGHARSGEVIWYWFSDSESYANFDEFYLSMLDYMRLELQRWTEGAGRKKK